MDIYRGTSIWLTIKTDDNTRLINQLLGEDIIKSSFNSHIFLDINIGDYIVYGGLIYHINSLPNIKKNSSNSFDYEITFESESYELLKTQFLDIDGNSDFYLVGNLETFIDLIVTNMNREHTDWVKGTCDQTNADYKLLNFSKANCMQALQKLCGEFEGEFYFEFELDFTEGARLPYLPAGEAVIGYKPAAEAEHGYKPAEGGIVSYTKDICFTDKAGSDSGLTFKYKQGLRNIHRTTLSEKNIITRLYAFGADKNLKSDYRDYSRRLKFAADGKSYLEKNIDKYGIIEHTEIFEDIYPHREGEISYVGAEITKFRDTKEPAMFDLNDYLLPGVTAKVHFNSGNLGGYEFEISNYNHTTKEFTIIAFMDDQGYEMPNATLKPAVGDKYVLIDIFLPQSYIDTAETALQAKAQTYLDDNCEPRVTYILEPDWRYFKVHLIELKAGDFITIEDTVLGIDVMTRIVELTKSVANEYKYTLKLTDHLEVQLIQRIYSEQEDLKEKIEIGYGGDIIRSRRNWRTSEELRTMVFDTDGYFDMGKIKPESVTTGMLSVGSKSTQFILKGIEIEGNYQSDVSKFHASAGSLIHLSIADEIRTWTLSENTQEDLVNETAYYIYAKCTKEPGYTGQVVVDETQRKFDDDPTYYYFLIGVLHSVVDSVRGVSLTYGQTIINGKFIRTGKIESTDGQVYFDLDNNDLVIKKESFASEAAGIWLGYDVDKYKFNIGVASKYLKWDGAALTIKGLVSADALSALNADLGHITAGDITLNTAGFIRTTGKTSYASVVAGFWLGYDGAYKLNLGNANSWIKWTGSVLDIKGTVVITGGSGIANLTDAGDLAQLDSLEYAALTGTKPPTNADHTADIVSDLAYYDEVSSAMLGSTIISGGYLRTDLIKVKKIYVGGGTDEDIYFEDSGIRMYDAVSSLKKQIYWRYGTVDFARLTYDSATTKETNLHLYAGAYNLFLGLKNTGVTGFITTGKQIVLGTGNALSSLMFWTGTRQLYLGVSEDAPTTNNYAGELIIEEGGATNALHLYTTAWRWIQSSLGW